MLRILSLIVEIEDESETNNILNKFKKELQALLCKYWERGEVRITLRDTADGVTKVARQPRVYVFIHKDVLIFDAGYAKGQIHIYELKKSLFAEELNAQLNRYGQSINWAMLRE